MRIAYLVSRYPAISHTFILREVLALRRLGLLIQTFSIRRADPGQLLSTADRDAFETTEAILPSNPTRIAAAHLIAALGRPVHYASTALLALQLSPGGARGALWQLFYFAEAILLWRRCSRQGISHIHAHFANVATDVALLAAHFGSRPGERWGWSFTMHGSAEFYDVVQHRLAQKVRRAEFVICISDFCRSQLMGFVDEEHWPKLRKVRGGVDPGAFEPKRVEVEANETEILHVGRLVQVKGQALLLEAMAKLLDRGLPVHATIVGDGPKRQDLDRLATRLGVAEHVRFTGSVGQDEIRSHYARADVFCLPSFAEGVPVVLMEAMAMGLPVVSTRVMGTPELVETGVSGLLVSPGRPELLADALERLVRAPDLRRAMGDAGREKITSEFDLNRSAYELHQIFMDDLPGRSAAGTLDSDATRLSARAGTPVAS